MTTQSKEWKLIKHQEKPSDEFLSFLRDPTRDGVLMIGNTGTGKTFVLADALAKAQNEGLFLNSNSLNPYRTFLLTPKRAITQQKRVFAKAGIKDYEVTNHSSLASSFGSLFITWNTISNRYGIDKVPVWDDESKPDLIIVDECQFVKNISAARSKIIQAAVKQKIKVAFVSATPFQKPGEAKLICVGTKVCRDFEDFDSYCWSVSPYGPTANSKAAIKRIKQDLINNNALISIKGARYPFKPVLNNVLIDLLPHQLPIYNSTLDKYYETLAKEGRNGPEGIFKIWVEQNKYREATDILKAEQLAHRAFQIATFPDCPRQVIIASNFVAALERIWSILVKKYGIDKNKISVLFGGQTDKQAQDNIDRFQNGETDYFLTTMKSGGTSISLHHEFESARPRYVLLPPTWSIYEYCQVLGRAQRITSLSQTIQEVVWFRGTIEERVAQVLDEKVDSISELIDKNENFIHKIFNRQVENSIDNEEYEKQLNENQEKESDNPDNENDGIDKGMFGKEEKEFGEE